MTGIVTGIQNCTGWKSAGKSTTIKIISGILTPTAGTCLVNGLEPYHSRKINAGNIGVVSGQRTQLWWDLPLGETYTVLKEVYEVSDRDFLERMAFFRKFWICRDLYIAPSELYLWGNECGQT